MKNNIFHIKGLKNSKNMLKNSKKRLGSPKSCDYKLCSTLSFVPLLSFVTMTLFLIDSSSSTT